MRIDDFVCLGRAVPEMSKKYGAKVCMAGYSQEMRSFIRIYPLEVVNPIICRAQCVLEVIRNPEDHRDESWKLPNQNQSILGVGPEVSTPSVVRFLRSRLVKSIDELNERRLSLGVLEVNGDCQGLFRSRSDVLCPDQGALFDFADEDRRFGAQALDIAPYLSFRDAAGKCHNLQIREWGAYEWLRKHRAEAAKVWSNLQIRDGRPTLLVVGNMNNQRTTWLIIKTFKDNNGCYTMPGFD